MPVNRFLLGLALAALVIPSVASSSAGLPTEETRIEAPGWVAYAIDFVEGGPGDAYFTFGLESSERMTSRMASMFIVPEPAWALYAISFYGSDGRKDGVQVTTFGGGGPSPTILGGTPNSETPRKSEMLKVNFINAPSGRWYFVFTGGARSEDSVDLVVRLQTAAAWSRTTGSDAWYADGLDFKETSASVAARSQSAHASSFGSYTFETKNLTFYNFIPDSRCACHLEGPSGDYGAFEGWDVDGGGFTAWKGAPGKRVISYPLAAGVRIDPESAVKDLPYGSKVANPRLVAADVTLPG